MKKLILSLALLSVFYTLSSSAMDQDNLPERDGGGAPAAPRPAIPNLSPEHPLLIGKDQAIVGFMTQFYKANAFDVQINSILAAFEKCDEPADQRIHKMYQILNPNSITYIYDVIWKLVDIPTHRYNSIVTSATQLLPPDQKNSFINLMLANISSLPEDKMSNIVEATAQFVENPLSATPDIIALLHNFKNCDEHPQDRAKKIAASLPHLLDPENPENARDIIGQLAVLPTKRFPDILNALLQSMRPDLDNRKVGKMLTTLRELPAAQINDIVEATLQVTAGLSTYRLWGYDNEFSAILCSFVDCTEPPQDRAEKIVTVLPFLRHPLISSHAGYIISKLARLPTERFADIAATAQELFKYTEHDCSVAQLLSSLVALPVDRMQGIVDAAKVFLSDEMSLGYHISHILTTLNSWGLSIEATLARAHLVQNQFEAIIGNLEIPLSQKALADTLIKLIHNPEAWA